MVLKILGSNRKGSLVDANNKTMYILYHDNTFALKKNNIFINKTCYFRAIFQIICILHWIICV